MKRNLNPFQVPPVALVISNVFAVNAVIVPLGIQHVLKAGIGRKNAAKADCRHDYSHRPRRL